MPKENTHLYFAHELLSQFGNERLEALILAQVKYYYFGSIAPDSFYYSAKANVRRVSAILHGKDGNLTNEAIFALLDKAKENQSEPDLCLALGYITHCALDMVFHPVIYYLSGNYYDADPAKATDAVYLHRHLETYLDYQINQSYFFNDLISFKILKHCSYNQIISQLYHISQKDIMAALHRKATIYSLLRSNIVLSVLYFFYRIVERSSWSRLKVLLGIFYGNLKRDSRTIPHRINYRDIITGESKTTTIYDLFNQAREKAVEMVDAGYAYYRGKISRLEAEQIIRGESLDTGRLQMPVSDLKYFYNN
ncbi:MAG: zinc dependent phospholipase C family protein [Candidatus Falkowbacteria bacterium]